MACRQTFNLKNKYGWKNLVSRRFDKLSRKYVLKDTFGFLVCFVLGHDIFKTDEGDACKRCWRFIKE